MIPSPLHPIPARGPRRGLFPSRRRRWGAAAIGAALLATLVSAGILARRAASEPTPAPDPYPVMPAGQASRGSIVIDVMVELEDGATHPNRLRLGAGDRLNLVVQNSSTGRHHFIVDGLGIHEDLSPGASARVIVSDPRPGTFRSWCAFDEHAERITFVVT